MRARLFREGVVTVDGRMLLDSVLPDAIIPLMFTPDDMLHMGDDAQRHTTMIGCVADVRREDDGWVTGDLITTHSLGGLAAEADFDSIGDVGAEDGVMVARHARLLAVTMGVRPVWEGMVIAPD